jgi:putative hydrolase of the HAD superfamily
MASTIDAVLLDLDDTLLDTAGVEQRRFAAVLPLLCAAIPDLDPGVFEQRYQAFDDGRDLVDRGVTPYETFRLQRLRHAVAPAGLVGRRLFAAYLELSYAIADTIQPLPGALDTLAALRQAGIATAIVTNGEAAWQRRKLELTGLVEAVDAVVISAEIGVAKPDAAPFLRACAALTAAPSRTVMVGDNTAVDIAGAAAAGLAGTVRVGAGGTPIADVPSQLLLADVS